MQPIPLVDTPQDTTWIYLLVTAGIFVMLSFVLIARSNPKVSKRPNLMIALALGALVVATLSAGLGLAKGPRPIQELAAKLDAQTASAQADIEDTYGLELTKGEVEGLKYPTDAPEKDFRVYGSIEQQEQVSGAQFIERTVYLVWADGKLQLSESEDGKSFTELEPTK